jgi:hypothetical protein
MIQCYTPYMLNTNLCDDWKTFQNRQITVAGDMLDSLVPDIATCILPAIFIKNGMDGRPSNLGVPEPERCARSGIA